MEIGEIDILGGKSMGKNRCYTYVDDNGKKYSEEDIFFRASDEDDMTKTWKLKKGQRFPNIFTPRTKAVEYGFPMSIVNKETGKRTDQKVTKEGNLLPLHAGSCRQIKAICFALPSAGKTTFYLKTIQSQEFLNALTGSRVAKNLSFMEDLVSRSGVQQHYCKLLKDIEEQHALPGNTLKGMNVTFPYHVVSEQDEALLCVTDISGEDCKGLRWSDSRITSNKYFLVMIDIEDIIQGRTDYIDLVEQLLKSLKMHRVRNDYEVLIILTKGDKLKNYFELDKEYAFENSIEIQNGKLELGVHKNGFDLDIFEEKEKGIEQYLRYICPNLVNLLRRYLGKRVRFFLIAAIGCDLYEFQTNLNNYKPYCIDEPWLYILLKENIISKANESISLEQILKNLFGIGA